MGFVVYNNSTVTDDLETELETKDTELATSKAELATSKAELATSKAELEEVNKELVVKKEELAKLNTDFSTKSNEYNLLFDSHKLEVGGTLDLNYQFEWSSISNYLFKCTDGINVEIGGGYTVNVSDYKYLVYSGGRMDISKIELYEGFDSTTKLVTGNKLTIDFPNDMSTYMMEIPSTTSMQSIKGMKIYTKSADGYCGVNNTILGLFKKDPEIRSESSLYSIFRNQEGTANFGDASNVVKMGLVYGDNSGSGPNLHPRGNQKIWVTKHQGWRCGVTTDENLQNFKNHADYSKDCPTQAPGVFT